MPRTTKKKTAETNAAPITPRVRRFEAAKFQPTLGFLPSLYASFNDELKQDLPSLRARSRDASINNPFARRYLKAITTNVIGPHGIQLKMGAKLPNGKPDDMANYMIEQRWLQFQKSVTTDGKNLREALKLALETVARDGEIFAVIRKGTQFGNYLVNLQFYEAEYVDINHNELAENGNEIRQGIEYDAYGKPVAYHIWRYHPNSTSVKATGTNIRVRIPAEEVIHIYNRERVTQGRGFPWLSAALIPLSHIHEYTKSELIASRVASQKMGFFVKPNTTEENVGDYHDDVDPNAFIQESQAGSFDVLPQGWQLQTFDPDNPNTNYSQFIKTVLEGVASALGVSYHTLSSDLSSANYSSLRQGALEERETYKECQQLLIEQLLTPLFNQWLTNLIAFQLEGIRLPMSKFDQFNAPVWRTRVWAAVDPSKDAIAWQIQLDQNLRSRTDVCRSFGLDYVDVLNEIAQEQALAKELGVVIEPTAEGSLNQAVIDAIVNSEGKPNTDDGANPPLQ